MQDVSGARAVAAPRELREAEQHYALGRQHKARNDLSAAEQAYRKALQLSPSYLDAWVSLGIVLRVQGKLAEAEHCQREAVRLNAGSFLAQLNLGTALSSQTRFSEAVDCFQRAVAIDPRSANAHCNLGIALLQLSDSRAAWHLSEALQLQPENFDAVFNLGRSFMQAGEFERAITAFAHAKRLVPASLESQFLFATAHFRAGRFEPARDEYERLVREHPTWSTPLVGLASLLAEVGEYDESRALFERALELNPDDAQARTYFGLLLLRMGDFARCWDFYESRSAALLSAHAIERGFTEPRWADEPLAGKTLLVTREQGFGDELLFASLLPDVLREARHVVIECDRRLEALFRRSFPGATVFAVDGREAGANRSIERYRDQAPRFDCWIPSGSLPRLRRRRAEDFPRHQGFFRADPERVAHWRARLDALGSGLKIGISWRGGTALTRASVRSLTLEALASVLEIPSVHFVSVQYGKCGDEIESFAQAHGVQIHHWNEAIDDYDETAALISALDLVISVCTAVVNLGGALNAPVWVMAPHVPDPRYGREGATMIWYPSVRVFRQPCLGAWAGVIDAVRDQLHRLTQCRSEAGR